MACSTLVGDVVGHWPEARLVVARASAIIATTAPLWLPTGKSLAVVRVGLVRQCTSLTQRALWRGFVDDLRAVTRTKVHTFYADSEPGLMDAVLTDKIHLGCLQDGRVVCRKHVDAGTVQRIRDWHAAHTAR